MAYAVDVVFSQTAASLAVVCSRHTNRLMGLMCCLQTLGAGILN